MATEILMNIKPILDILSAVVHTFIISLFVSFARPKSFANGWADISNAIDIINVTMIVSIIPYLIQSSILFLFFIP